MRCPRGGELAVPAPGVSVVFSYVFVFNIEGGSRDSYPFDYDNMLMSTDGLRRIGAVQRAPSAPRDRKGKATAAASEDRMSPAGERELNFAPWVIVRAMNGVQPEVHRCYERLTVAGIAMVRVVVDVAGKVTSASVAGPFAGTPTGACVETAVKKASFPPSSGGGIMYPFRLP